MNRLWDRLGASRPFTWQSVVWMGLGLLVLSPGILVETSGHDLWTWRGVLLVALLSQALLTFLVSTFVTKRRRIVDAPVLTWVAVIGLSIAFPVFFRLSIVYVFHLPPTSAGFVRFFTASTIWLLGTLVFAVAVSDTRAFRRELGRLNAQLEEERRLEASEKDSLKRVRQKIIDGVRRELRTAFANMSHDSNPRNVGTQLDALIDDVVRPLSQQLSSPGMNSLDGEQSKPFNGVDRIRTREVLARLTQQNPFEFVFTPFVVSFSTLTVKTWSMPVQTALWSSVLGTAIIGLLLFAAHSLFNAMRRSRHTRLPIAAIFFVFFLIAFTNTVTVRVLLGITPSASRLLLIFFELGVLLLIAVIRAVPSERKRVLQELEESVASIQWMNSRLAQMNWVEHQKFARLVHGDIQARILATSLQGRIDAQHDALSTAQLVELQSQCEAALTAPLQSGSFASFIDSLTLIWQASVTISHDLSDEMVTAIDGDPIARDAVVETVREALNNAVKHAGATEVTVSVLLESPDATERGPAHTSLVLTVRSNAAGESGLGRLSSLGMARPGQSRPGQGMAMFDQLSSEWSLELAEGSTILTARIPTGQDTVAH